MHITAIILIEPLLGLEAVTSRQMHRRTSHAVSCHHLASVDRVSGEIRDLYSGHRNLEVIQTLLVLNSTTHPYSTMLYNTPLPYYALYHTPTLPCPTLHSYPTMPYITPLPYHALQHTPAPIGLHHRSRLSAPQQ